MDRFAPSTRRSLLASPFAVLALAAVLTVAVVACGSGGGGPAVKLSAAGKRGQTVAGNRGCVACHTSTGGRSTGPTWKGLAGSTVKLESGTTTADDAYLRRSVTDPRTDVVAGYANIMQPYKLTARELDDLIAYLHDLSPKPGS